MAKRLCQLCNIAQEDTAHLAWDALAWAHVACLEAPIVGAKDILDQIADILYPMDGHPEDQWNGGDVCEELNNLLCLYRPTAPYRQTG